MREITKKELYGLFRIGDFTLVYWDRGQPEIYKGKWDIQKEYEKDEYATMEKSKVEIPQYDMNGYAPDIVVWLAEALKGKVDSI